MKVVFYGIAFGFGMKLGRSIYGVVDHVLVDVMLRNREHIDTVCDKLKVTRFNWDYYTSNNDKEINKSMNKIGF